MQAPGAGIDPASRHQRRVFTEGRGVVHVALFQTHTVTVFQVDRGDQQHGRERGVGKWAREIGFDRIREGQASAVPPVTDSSARSFGRASSRARHSSPGGIGLQKCYLAPARR